MAVYLNVDNLVNIKFCPPWEKDSNPIAVPVQKDKLVDFFPRTQKELSGYLRNDIFEKKLTAIIRDVVAGMKSAREEMENLAAQNTQGGYLHPALQPKKEDYPKGLNDFHHAQHVRQTNMELKSRILEAIEREDWYMFEKMEMADKMYEESKQYFKAAGTEVAMFAAGFGIGKMSRVAKSGKKLSGEIFQRDYSVKGVTANRQWRMEFGYTANGKTRTLHLLDADLANGNMAAWNQVYGEAYEHLHPEDTFEPIDCLRDFGTAGLVAGTVNPYIGIASTFVNTVGNAVLGGTYYFAGKRIRAIEEETKRKDAEFLSKLKSLIYDDFNALQEKEIETLIMKLLGITKEALVKLLGINQND